MNESRPGTDWERKQDAAGHEAARLAALHRLDVLDTPREEAFDRISRLVCRVLDVPVALVSLIDAHR